MHILLFNVFLEIRSEHFAAPSPILFILPVLIINLILFSNVFCVFVAKDELVVRTDLFQILRLIIM